MNELVTLKNDRAVCDSLEVADKFHKNHKNVLRNIENLAAQNCATKKLFHKTKYVDSRGKGQPKYFMNRDGFSLLAMGFTGKEALEWKLKYISAFNEMEKIISEKSTGLWIETRTQGKLTRKSETDTIKELIEYAQRQGSKNSDRLYMVYSKLANSMAGVADRNLATTTQLNNLSLMENIILHCIKSGIVADKHYKAIYQDCKHRLITFKDIAYLESVG